MINPKLNINKPFREQVDNFINNKFVPTTQPFIRSTIAKNKTRVLPLLIFYETRINHKNVFKVLSCVIYTIINSYVCINYQPCE